jgi:hypothetical protein
VTVDLRLTNKHTNIKKKKNIQKLLGEIFLFLVNRYQLGWSSIPGMTQFNSLVTPLIEAEIRAGDSRSFYILTMLTPLT